MALPETQIATEAMTVLATAVDGVITDRSANSAQQLGDEIAELRRQIDRLEGAFVERLRRFERLRGHLKDGAVSIIAWLRHRCRLSGRDAVVHASVARSLPEIAGASDLLLRADIGFGHASVIAQAVDDLGPKLASTHGETMLDAARQMDCDRFALVVRHLRHSIDASGELADARAKHAARYLSIGYRDAMCTLDGQLDCEGGALVRAALEPLARPTPGDQRTVSMRRADALVELARRQLSGATGLPATGGMQPHVIVTTTIATLAGVKGAPAGELSGGGTVPSETVRRLACDARITRLDQMNDDGEPRPGEERRTIPPRLRRALVARDSGCRFPSCDRPPEWTDAHHIVHWVDGGKTRLTNLVLLCRAHHRYVHEDGWRIAWTDGGLVAHPP